MGISKWMLMSNSLNACCSVLCVVCYLFKAVFDSGSKLGSGLVWW